MNLYQFYQVAYHLQQLQKLLLPTKTTKMCLWTLQQDKQFFQSNNDSIGLESKRPKRSTLFDIISKELDITPEQAKKIQEHR